MPTSRTNNSERRAGFPTRLNYWPYKARHQRSTC